MTLHDQIQDAETALADAIASRDSAAVVALYTADARLLPDGGPTMAGSREIASFFDQAFSQGIVGSNFVTLEVDGSAEYVIEIGKYELYAQSGNGPRTVAGSGRYLVAWKCVEGKWRLHRDIFNRVGGAE
ncbi:nuclear transport factor 2 family protein [Cupriavidus basilensis]|uniref:Nuclear transport factor 2 family protein n=1 Tax=Cupriavidus basilensis TaxID=68895 RepID=A0ABT6AG70_9BURK|nr:nuclear transport factor 2 family protein [Cupriavidus basilensis]MDF3831590.1 nuclear transport factor 2 family protein [Cupriavidus basilensis]